MDTLCEACDEREMVSLFGVLDSSPRNFGHLDKGGLSVFTSIDLNS